MHLLDLYNKTPYEPLVPKKSDASQNVFKFNSPQHYVSWVSHLDEHFGRGAEERSSENGDFSFTQSQSLADAYELIRGTVFDKNDIKDLEAKISDIKKHTMFSDEGYEIDVAEHLSGSDKVWVKGRDKTRMTRVINDTLLIEATYCSGQSSSVAKQIGIALIRGIYRRRVIPRKIIIAFAGARVRRNDSSQHLVTIDVTFQDLNGIAKMLHPSAFRRLWFRIAEIYPDLVGGYGRPPEDPDTKGYLCFENLFSEFNGKEDSLDGSIDTFLGVIKKK